MAMEIFMDLTDALLQLFLVNSIIPAKKKEHTVVQSVGFLFCMTTFLCLMTFLNLNLNPLFNFLFGTLVLVYASLRNSGFDISRRIAISFMSTYLALFSTSMAFSTTYYLFELTPVKVLLETDIYRVLSLVGISRGIFLVTAKLIIYFYKKKIESMPIKQKHLVIFSIAFILYGIVFNTLLSIFNSNEGIQGLTVGAMFLFGATVLVSLIQVFSIAENSYKESFKVLEQQKKTFDDHNLISYTENITALMGLKQDIIEMLTPVVQILNEFEYEEARQMLEDYLGILDVNTKGVHYKLNSHIETAINLKVEECKQGNIAVKQKIKVDKLTPSIFNNEELLTIVVNLFDISMLECDNNNDSNFLYFTFDTRETGIFLETKYVNGKKPHISDNSIIDFLPEKLLKVSLSKLGGYATCVEIDGQVVRKVMLPYTGKSYYLRGSNTSSDRS